MSLINSIGSYFNKLSNGWTFGTLNKKISLKDNTVLEIDTDGVIVANYEYEFQEKSGIIAHLDDIFPPVHIIYNTQVELLADQVNQKTGYIYYVIGDTVHYEKLSTNTSDISNYRIFGGLSSSYQRDKFIYSGSNDFLLTRNTPNAIQVFLNGQKLEFTDDWSISGNTVTVNTPLLSDDEISIEYFYSTQEIVPSNINGTGTSGYLTKWNSSTELGVSLIQDNGTSITLPSNSIINAVSASVDTDKFLVLDSTTIKYRTGIQLLSDIGAFTNPMTTLGDIIYGGVSGVANRLAGNNTTTKRYLSQTGNGTSSAIPSWSTIVGSDITGEALTSTNDTNVTITLGGTPTTALLRATSISLGWTGSLAVGRGGSGATTLTGVLIGNGTSAFTGVVGTASQLLRRNTGNSAYEFFTHDFVNQAGVRTSVSLTTTGTSGVATYSSSTGVFNIPNYTYTHPTFTAFTPTLTGANVLATFATNTNGHVTTLTTRALTVADIGAIGGSGTTGRVPLFTGATVLGNSEIYQIGTNVMIGTTTDNLSRLRVNGTTFIEPSSTTSNALILKGLPSQTGVDMFIITNSGGTEVHKFDVFGNSLQLGNHVVFGQIYSPINSIGTVGTGTVNIDWNTSNSQYIILVGNPTFTFSNPQAGASYQIIIAQDGTGGRTITWPTIHWEGKTVPSLTGTANSVDVVTLTYDGSKYLGVMSKNHGTP